MDEQETCDKIAQILGQEGCIIKGSRGEQIPLPSSLVHALRLLLKYRQLHIPVQVLRKGSKGRGRESGGGRVRLSYRWWVYAKNPWKLVREVIIDPTRVFWQRGRRGWAVSDTWSMDIYLADLIAQMLHYLADHSHGYPSFLPPDEEKSPFTSYEQWQAYLHDLAQSFEDYRSFMEGLSEKHTWEEHDALIARMRRLFDYYRDLWD